MNVQRANEVLREAVTKYDKTMKTMVDKTLGDIIKSASQAKNHIDEPWWVAMMVADIVAKSTVVLVWLYKSNEGSKKLEQAAGRLDKMPAVIRSAVEGWRNRK